MEIYAVLNQKGGSCKTTTSVNLASALAEKKKKVLLIDLDSQASASAWFGFKKPEKGLYTLFTENSANGSILDIISKTAIPGLDIIVASPWLVSADKILAGEVGAETILKKYLDKLKSKPWDYIVIDCSPTLGILSLNALVAADKVLVPIETHIMAVQGLAQLMNTVTMVKDRLNSRLEIDGILACRVNKRTRLSQDILADLRKRFPTKVYKTIIRESIRLAEAPSFGKPITLYGNKSSGAEDYRSLAAEVIKRTTKQL
ncbi:ParA family protein [Candidatus Dependentiae bacterium]|nr:MAG: ParA family protein [Candidatus Dependentiae bacterium]